MKAINTADFQEFINNYKTKQEERANKGLGLEYFGPKEMQMLLDRIPTVDAELVRHGRWIETDYFDAHKVPIYECSVCFRGVADHYIKCHKYCLHCGAKMDLEENHDGKD